MIKIRNPNSKSIVLLITVLIFLASSGTAIPSEIIDLTHPFDDKTIYWPTSQSFQLEKVSWGYTKKGYFYSGNKFSAPEHGGTHLDAPIHFAKGKWTVEKIPVDRLVGKAAVIDLRFRVGSNADYLISKEDITNWEKKFRDLSSQDIVLFNTGWSRYWGNKKKYLGTDKLGDTKNLRFPGLSKAAAKYLVKRKVKGVGLDTASLDYGKTKNYIAHRILLKANIYGLENVAHLNKLPVVGATLYVAPMKIRGGTGAPTRIYAVIE